MSGTASPSIRAVVQPVASSVVGDVAGGGGFSPLTNLALDAITPSLAISTQYLGGIGNGQAWADARYPTVKVEKGYGSTVFQDLYPDPTTGELFTEPNGGGVSATAFAAGAKLLVETPYNQALAGPLASGHPAALTDASRRWLLDIATPALPRFDSLVGTQDASQHATERGYSAGLSIATNAPWAFFIGDQNNPDAFDETSRPLQSASGTLYVQHNQNNRQSNCFAPGGTQGFLMRPAKRPFCRVAFNGSKVTTDGNRYITSAQSEFCSAGTNLAASGTSLVMQIGGATTSLNGYGYFFVGITATRLTKQLLQTVSRKLTRLFKGAFAAGEFTLLSPVDNEVIPMDLDTETADIPIRLMGEPSTTYEAQHVSGSYVSIGTSDTSGYLDGVFPNAPKANGTLTVRKVGSVTTVTAPSIAVGIVIGKWGQSNMDGRGDNVTHTIPSGSLRIARDVGWFNDTATSKSWLRILQQRLYDQYGCVIASAGYAVGNSYLTRASGSHDAEWDKDNAVTTLPSAYHQWVSLMQLCENCNFVLGHQGENDAFDSVTKSQYKAALQGLLAGWRSEWRSDLKLYNISIGRDTASGNKVDPIRLAQQELWDESPADFPALGCVAHLPTTVDGVHFSTLGEKAAVVDVVERHLFGSGRGPRFSSMIVSGTTITITCTGGVSPLTISGGEAASPIGWTVTDSGGSKTVTAVSVSGLEITLTVNSSLSGTATVKWLSHYTGVGTTLLDSDGTTPVPPEPFNQSVAVT